MYENNINLSFLNPVVLYELTFLEEEEVFLCFHILKNVSNYKNKIGFFRSCIKEKYFKTIDFKTLELLREKRKKLLKLLSSNPNELGRKELTELCLSFGRGTYENEEIEKLRKFLELKRSKIKEILENLKVLKVYTPQ